jgi:hypothetical protein
MMSDTVEDEEVLKPIEARYDCETPPSEPMPYKGESPPSEPMIYEIDDVTPPSEP